VLPSEIDKKPTQLKLWLGICLPMDCSGSTRARSFQDQNNLKPGHFAGGDHDPGV